MIRKEINNSLEHTEDSFQKLSIQVSLNGLSFCVLDTIGKKLDVSYSRTFHKELTPFELENELKEALREQGISDHPFSEVVVIHKNSLYSLVPQALFQPTALSNYLKFNAKIFATDHLDYDTLEGLEAVNVYVPFANVNNHVYELFGEFEFKHSTSVLLETLIKLPLSGQGKSCYVHLAESQMDMAVFSNKQLLFFNSYGYTSETDFMYYLLFALEQLQLDPAVLKLRLMGEVEEGDPIVNLCSEYVEQVSLFVPANQHLKESPDDPPLDFTLISTL